MMDKIIPNKINRKPNKVKNKLIRGISLFIFVVVLLVYVQKAHAGDTAYFIYDRPGRDITALSDSAGSVINTYKYNAFGGISSKNEQVSNEHLYVNEVKDEETELIFLRYRSDWWYIIVVIFIFVITKLLTNAKQESVIKYDRIQKIILYSLGIPLLVIIFFVVILFIRGGFLGDLANDLSMIMVTILAVVLLLIPLVYVFLKKKKATRQDKKVRLDNMQH